MKDLRSSIAGWCWESRDSLARNCGTEWCTNCRVGFLFFSSSTIFGKITPSYPFTEVEAASTAASRGGIWVGWGGHRVRWDEMRRQNHRHHHKLCHQSLRLRLPRSIPRSRCVPGVTATSILECIFGSFWIWTFVSKGNTKHQAPDGHQLPLDPSEDPKCSAATRRLFRFPNFPC